MSTAPDDAPASAGPRLIDLMIVGAPKAGTTSLKSYLGQHPGMFTHPQREFIYFAHDDEFARGFDRAWQLYFAGARPGCAIAAKSVAMMYSPEALRRLRAHNPGVRVVLVLRDPVARAYSEFTYARRRGRESADSFEEAVARCLEDDDADPREPGAYLVRGRYAEFIEPILDLFPRGQVSVLPFETVTGEPVAACQGLFRELDGLDATFVPTSFEPENPAADVWSRSLLGVTADRSRLRGLRRGLRLLVGERSRQRIRAALQRLNDRSIDRSNMGTATRARLADYYAPWNRRLAESVGTGFAGWIAPA